MQALEPLQPDERLEYLSLLAEQYPTVQALCTEIVNLRAIVNLPKGTEHFISDLHGEYEAFCHILNNASGVIREKAEALFGGELDAQEMSELLTLLYYPEAKLLQLSQRGAISAQWYVRRAGQLIRLGRLLSSKYTRSKVRKAMQPAYAYIMDELLHAQPDEDDNQLVYHQKILDTLIGIGGGDEFILSLCALAKRLAVDRLHIVGDIFDRGPRADSILDLLAGHHAVDVQWGNHDALWMGAACGSQVCIAAVVRGCLQYGNMEILETGYGISLRALSLFAQRAYPMLPLDAAQAHAAAVLMIKLEGQLIRRRPEYGMDARLLLEHVAGGQESIWLEGAARPVRPLPLPTVDPADPYALRADEQALMQEFSAAFAQSERLHRHIAFLYRQGSLCRVENGNLLLHGCVPMTEGGALAHAPFAHGTCAGPAMMRHHEQLARRAYFQRDPAAVDFMWYLSTAERSPLCGRRLRTFERLFVTDPACWHEEPDPYYRHCETPEGCARVLRAFGLNETEGHIVNGHTPVLASHGESPVKAGGRMIVIDGGFCRAMQEKTGIAGYTLIANSHGMRIVAHRPFTSIADALLSNSDISAELQATLPFPRRMMVGDTDNGHRLLRRIQVLEELLGLYQSGWVHGKGQ
jgi:fructose-1,6-bisphosphatase-3